MSDKTTKYEPDWTDEMKAISVGRPIFTVYEGTCYWSMPDGSCLSITPDDAKRINEALQATEDHPSEG